MTPGIVAIIAVLLALVLPLRSFRSRRLGARSTLLMMLVWTVLIVVLAIVFERSGLQLPSRRM